MFLSFVHFTVLYCKAQNITCGSVSLYYGNFNHVHAHLNYLFVFIHDSAFHRHHQSSDVLSWLDSTCTCCVASGNKSTIDTAADIHSTTVSVLIIAPSSLLMKTGIRISQFNARSYICLLICIQDFCIQQLSSEVRGVDLAGWHVCILCGIWQYVLLLVVLLGMHIKSCHIQDSTIYQYVLQVVFLRMQGLVHLGSKYMVPDTHYTMVIVLTTQLFYLKHCWGHECLTLSKCNFIF